ncbi:MAG: tRNA 2-thiouridine(34) synthase MnmA [bacterium]
MSERSSGIRVDPCLSVVNSSPSVVRVAVGMSGGIDSSVAAALLAGQGYEVIGLTLHMFKEGSRCCSLEDVNRARKVCDHLGIRHYVMNVVDAFRDAIIKPWADAYARGRTPNPCILCNRHFKFGALMTRAEQLGCSFVATGHYVRLDRRNDGPHLLRGVDPLKDQSYFLHRLTRGQLEKCLFPLGDMTKAEVKAYAATHSVPVEGHRETTDLCFIHDDGPAPVVEQFHPELVRQGPILDTNGKVLGEHRGFHRYTIGQRDGLRFAAGRRVYVKEVRPADNAVVVADRNELMREDFLVEEPHWILGEPQLPADLTVRIRYRTAAVAARVSRLDNGSLLVELSLPQFAVTPGQAAVFQQGDEVLGGGWIM